MGTICGGTVGLNDLEQFGRFEADEKSISRQLSRSQMSLKNPGKSGFEPTAPTRSEDCALLTQPKPQLQNRWFIGCRWISNQRRKPQRNVDNGNSKECRSFDLDLHCNTFKIRFGPRIRRPARRCMQARLHTEHASAKRGHQRLFFGPRT